MKSLWFFSMLATLAHIFNSPSASAATVTINGHTAGATVFISQVNATVAPAQSLDSVQFTIIPKPESVTRPVSATYTSEYLESRGCLNPQTGALVVPVFGLYASYANTISLKYHFTDGSTQNDSVTISTGAWVDSCGGLNNPIIVQDRTNTRSLSYDYMLLKNICGPDSPVLMDTDGAVRWVGTAGYSTLASMFFDNAIYISSPPAGTAANGLAALTGIARMELDGTIRFLRDYSYLGVTSTGHHNFDPGRQGILMDVDTTKQTESVVMEVDAAGNPLHTWDVGGILASAMIAGGDNPSPLVRSATLGPHCPMPSGCEDDWFHNNSAAYRRKDDSLVVSGREDFVIDLDYDTNAIKWILGDPTKAWYQYASLRHFALQLGPNTLPPIGQHAVSITHDNNLLLFDDGYNSITQNPAGTQRDYSAQRKYHIKKRHRVARETWTHTDENLYSPFCSSIYEDAPLNYLIDYAIIEKLPNGPFAELIGLDASEKKVFDYRFKTPGCSPWNAVPIHLESLTFDIVHPVSVVSRKVHGAAGAFDINLPLNGTPGIECRSGGANGDYQVIFTFAKPVTAGFAALERGADSHAESVAEEDGNQVTVNLTGVGSTETLTIELSGVSDGTNFSDVSVPLTVNVGDINGDGVVDESDVNLIPARRGRVKHSNFRKDVTVDGAINSADKALVEASSNLGP